jgi:primosomal protein N' (replication factor Y)
LNAIPPVPGKLVEVAVPRPVWSTFSYILPDILDGGDIVGCRVAVPFGSSRLTGYMLGYLDEYPPEGVKSVLERLDSSPLLPRGVLELTRWATAYYQAPSGMMLASAHPPGMSGSVTRMVARTGEITEGSGPDIPGTKEGTPVERLRGSLPDDYPFESWLAGLEASRLIRTWWQPSDLPAPFREVMIEAVPDPDEAVIIAERIRPRAPRQAEILFCLATAQEPLPRKEVLLRTSGSASAVSALRMKGFVRESYRELPRDPLAHLLTGKAESPPELNTAQETAVNAIKIHLGTNRTFLLHGVTGSGKTEVYLRVIEELLDRNQGALVLVPEISLTPLLVSRFHRRFPGMVTVLHSALSKGERLDSWNMVRSGSRPIVIGARSAVFSPVLAPGIIIVDEEHDQSYKQNEQPRYNGRDLAVVRGAIENIPVVLGSASPSMESYSNALSRKYELLELPDRIQSRPLPQTLIVPSGSMPNPLLSDELLSGIGKRTGNGEQTIVLINRRGFAPTQICRSCGHMEKCPRCGVSLTYHRKGESLRCHYCSFWRTSLKSCPECRGSDFAHMGPGIQKVEEMLGKNLPGTRVIRMDSDTTRGRRAHWKILEAFERGEGDVLLGTQMVAKGHDFPNVTLVGIIAADMGLSLPDFRAAERVFQLVLQVAGRAGRACKPGEVIVQTADPRDPVIRAACSHDFRKFWKLEEPVRKAFGYPPSGNVVRFLWSGLNGERVRSSAETCCDDLQPPEAVLFPPQEAAFPRINRRWRWSTIAKSGSRQALAELSVVIRQRFEEFPVAGVRLDVDVDPYNLL